MEVSRKMGNHEKSSLKNSLTQLPHYAILPAIDYQCCNPLENGAQYKRFSLIESLISLRARFFGFLARERQIVHNQEDNAQSAISASLTKSSPIAEKGALGSAGEASSLAPFFSDSYDNDRYLVEGKGKFVVWKRSLERGRKGALERETKREHMRELKGESVRERKGVLEREKKRDSERVKGELSRYMGVPRENELYEIQEARRLLSCKSAPSPIFLVVGYYCRILHTFLLFMYAFFAGEKI